jgi:hypothetical protein
MPKFSYLYLNLEYIYIVFVSKSCGSNAYNFILNGAEMSEMSEMYYASTMLTQHLLSKPTIFGKNMFVSTVHKVLLIKYTLFFIILQVNYKPSNPDEPVAQVQGFQGL